MGKNEKQGRNAVLKFSEHKRKRLNDLEADIDALFRLPLSEFTGARNALAARLKKSGRGEEKGEAALVKALGKPPVSAWAVNQLYWDHREAFDQLIASGERFHKAQTSGKIADMRIALDARREALSGLSDLATSLLQDADHNPSLDTIRRVTTTLEGMSAYASRSDAPRPGRLTHDVDPSGFESFASFVPGAGRTQPAKERARQPARLTPSPKSGATPTNTRRKVATDDGPRQVEETRKAKIAEAKASLQDARRSLTAARAKAQRLEAAQKKVDAEAKKAEQHRRDAEQSLQKAKAASEDAARRARNAAVETQEAVTAVDDAERAVEKASQEIDSLVRESSGK
jgi:Skp family chaperone for outer membrane proteins